jgi:hypothetical protein
VSEGPGLDPLGADGDGRFGGRGRGPVGSGHIGFQPLDLFVQGVALLLEAG